MTTARGWPRPDRSRPGGGAAASVGGGRVSSVMRGLSPARCGCATIRCRSSGAPPCRRSADCWSIESGACRAGSSTGSSPGSRGSGPPGPGSGPLSSGFSQAPAAPSKASAASTRISMPLLLDVVTAPRRASDDRADRPTTWGRARTGRRRRAGRTVGSARTGARSGWAWRRRWAPAGSHGWSRVRHPPAGGPFRGGHLVASHGDLRSSPRERDAPARGEPVTTVHRMAVVPERNRRRHPIRPEASRRWARARRAKSASAPTG